LCNHRTKYKRSKNVFAVTCTALSCGHIWARLLQPLGKYLIQFLSLVPSFIYHRLVKAVLIAHFFAVGSVSPKDLLHIPNSNSRKIFNVRMKVIFGEESLSSLFRILRQVLTTVFPVMCMVLPQQKVRTIDHVRSKCVLVGLECFLLLLLRLLLNKHS